MKTSLPIVTDCAAAIDQIINVVHQPAKLTFHRHRALLQRIYDLLKREQTGNKAQSIEGGRPRAHTVADMAPNGQPLTTYDVPAPKGCTRRDDTAWPYRVVHTNDPEPWHRTRNRKPTHNTDTRRA
jgi:hypothetical protein